jgi:TRAP-type C4-dicarboxylate transport system permease small subunit
LNGVVQKIDRWLSAIEYVLIGGLTLAALTIGTLQVLLRYSFNTGYTWSEEAFTLCTIAAMLFAGSRAVRDDAHVRVELVPLLVSPKVGKVLRLVAHMATLLLCAYYAYAGLLYAQFTYQIGSVSPNSGTPDWVIYCIVPATLGLFALRYVIRIYRVLRDEDIDTTHGFSTELAPKSVPAP